MIEWPADVPDSVLQTGYREQLGENVLRTAMDAGPVKTRRRFTAVPRAIRGAIKVSGAQLDLFDAWYIDTLGHGSLAFNWLHPRSAEPVRMRFTDRPEYTPAGGNRWQVSLSLEVLP